MRAIVKEFFIPMGFCFICATGGWILGRDSAPTRVAAGTANNSAVRVHAQPAGLAEHRPDTTRPV